MASRTELDRQQLTAITAGNIREARRRSGLSLAAVAAQADVSAATMSRIETGKQAIDVALLIALANIIGVNAAVLVRGGSPDSDRDSIVEALVNMPNDERRTIIRAVNEERVRRGRPLDLIDDLLDETRGAAEKLAAVQKQLEAVATATVRRSR